ncbi:ABC transporter permease protein [Chitinispirillum alkaliphilum]|nr:ABC transporter permease protein [Chitinispirillum alkaliphilum]
MLSRLVAFINYLGKSGMEMVDDVVGMAGLLFDTLCAAAGTAKNLNASFSNQMSRQILYTGVEAFWLVGIIAFLAGNTIILQAMNNMPLFGVTEYFGNILVIAVVRELGPFFTALVVIGRSGAALAAHIGNMRVSREIAALEVMGVDPVNYLVFPGLVGMIGSMICLNIYFDLIAIIGGLVVAKVTVDVPFLLFMGKVLEALTTVDVLVSLGKSVVFGTIIAIVSCHYGFKVKNIRGVPQASIRAVVTSMTLIIVLNILVTIGYYAY